MPDLGLFKPRHTLPEYFTLYGRLPILTENILNGDYYWMLPLMRVLISFPLWLALIGEWILRAPDHKVREYATRSLRKEFLFTLICALFILQTIELILK